MELFKKTLPDWILSLKMPKLPKPNSDKTDILYFIIKYNRVSFKDFYWLDFRKRLSELRNDYGLVLTSELITDSNRHGRPYNFKEYKLPIDQREKAIDIYHKLIANKKAQIKSA